MISRTKEFVKISNIMGPSQNPRVKGLPGLAPVQPCDNGLIMPMEDFLGRFPYPARRWGIARSVTTKQSHRWDRPAPRGTAHAGMRAGGTPRPAEVASSLRPRKNGSAASTPKKRPHGKQRLILAMLYVKAEGNRKACSIAW